MTYSIRGKSLATVVSALGLGLIAGPAQADLCASLPSTVLVTGSSASKTAIAAVAQVFAQENPPITVLYASQGSCVGVNSIIDPTTAIVTAATKYWAGAGAGTETACDLPLSGRAADIGVSDVYPGSCELALPSTAADFHGPIQVMNFVVPPTSSQRSISAEAAYFVFGFGAPGMVTPWTEEISYFVRDATSGTQQMISRALSKGGVVLPATKWKGIVNAKSDGVVSALATGSAEKTIGILNSADIDKNSAKVRGLAFRSFKQNCAYYPDSTDVTHDKANVRDGHYDIWGPLHFMTAVDGTGKATNPLVARVLAAVTGDAIPAKAILDAEIASSIVPTCAMRVKRTTEVGPLSSYQPPKSCGCYFEAKSSGATACTKCNVDTDCPAAASHCNVTYCEVQ